MRRIRRTSHQWSTDSAARLRTIARVAQVFPVLAAICAIFNTLGWAACLLTALVLGGATLIAVRRSRTERQSFQHAADELIARKRSDEAVFVLPSANSLDALDDRVTKLAHEAPVRSPEPLLRESLQLRSELMSRLESARGPQLRISLSRLASIAACVVADTQLSLGNVRAAAGEIDSAWQLASNDDSVRVWCASARAWVAYLDNQPRLAVEAARAGQRYCHTEGARQRLLSMEGSALALAGDRAGALEAFSLADNAGQIVQRFDPVFDGIGGIFAASQAKQLQNEANGLTLLGLPGRAVSTASRAIELFSAQSGDSWDYSLEAGSWVTLGISFLMLDRPDRVWEALQPVLALPPARRTSYIVMKLRDLLATVDTTRSGNSSDGQSLRTTIGPYIAAAIAA